MEKETRKSSLVGKGAGIYQYSSSRSSIQRDFSRVRIEVFHDWLKCHDSFLLSYKFL